MYNDNFHEAAHVAEWLRALIFHYRTQPLDHLTAVSGVGSSPALATRETSQVLCQVVFLGVLPFKPQPTDWIVSYELK